MKQDDGLIFDKDLFNKLIKMIHKKKMLNLEIGKKVKIKKSKFEELIKYILLKERNNVCDKDVLLKILELMDRFSINYNEKTDDVFEDYIETNIPMADNGIPNDNYVLTSGLDLTNNNMLINYSYLNVMKIVVFVIII